MKQKTRHKTTITKQILKEVQELASQGFNNIQVGKSLNIATQTLSTNRELKESIQRGKVDLAKKVTKSVLDTLEDDSSMKQLLVKRLCLFNPIVDIKKPTNAKDALSNLSTATKLYANGSINESQLKTIEAVSNSYAKTYEVTELEERITRLEELADER